MAINLTTHDIGSAPNDGTGDPLRTAFDNINTDNATLEEAFTKFAGITTQTGTAYTLVIGDAGHLVTMNNAAANTLTIPANASVAFPVGTQIDVVQLGAGQTSIALTTDTLRGDVKVSAQYAAVSLVKIATTEWVVIGGVA